MTKLRSSIVVLLIAAPCFLAKADSAGDASAVPPGSAIPAAAASEPSAGVRSFLQSHCYECHDADTRKGALDLTELKLDPFNPQSLRKWTAVYDRVHAGDMPPAKKPRPDPADVTALLAGLEHDLSAADLSRQRSIGRVPLRRLNSTEYENTLRDVLAMPMLEIKEMLPPDARAGGFDNVASAQDISYVQMARYLDAADWALNTAICLSSKPQKITGRALFREAGRFGGEKRLERGESRHLDEWVVFLRQPNNAQTPWTFGVKAPIRTGTYTIRVRCRGAVYDHGKILPQDRNHVASIYTRQKRLLGTFDVPPEAGVVEFKTWLYDQDSFEFFCATLDDRSNTGIGDTLPYKGPGIAVDYVEVEGPTEAEWPRESHRRLFGDLPVVAWKAESGLARPGSTVPMTQRDPRHPKKGAPLNKDKPPKDGYWMVASKDPMRDAERLLRDFMARINRRPVEEAEVQRCLQFAREAIEQKRCFQDAMLLAYKAALCSPDFLFLQESPGPLDAYALASRLSYFLWRSAPDETLLRLAASGELAQPAVLDQQITRLLADSESRRFVSDFTGQWLDLREIQATVPDKTLFPEFFCDNMAVESMVGESEAFFREMLASDLPASTAIASNFLTINERLAEVYGIPDVKGCAIRKVPLPAGSSRGGFLTQASVLKVTANGLRTSPVIRGAWVMDRLLGEPVPPPPPDAGTIDPDTRGATTVRQQLDLHRRNQTCAACHAKIDPPGFALESFDVMGTFRTRYRSLQVGDPIEGRVRDRKVGYKNGPPVDCTGQTADGKRFADISDFRNLLLEREDQVARNLARRLATFATGAEISFADRARIEKILSDTKATHYGLQSLVRGIVMSDLFRDK